MSITFNGITLTVGAPFNADRSFGRAGGMRCRVADTGGLGASLDPFWFEIPCECLPQPGDTITVDASTILFFDVTTIEWNLCGGECRGRSTSPGFSLGLEIKRVRWVVE